MQQGVARGKNSRGMDMLHISYNPEEGRSQGVQQLQDNIALMNHMCKVLMMILLQRLKTQVEPYLAEEQAGFRSDRNTTQQILIMRLLAEKAKRKGKKYTTVSLTFRRPSTP